MPGFFQEHLRPLAGSAGCIGPARGARRLPRCAGSRNNRPSNSPSRLRDRNAAADAGCGSRRAVRAARSRSRSGRRRPRPPSSHHRSPHRRSGGGRNERHRRNARPRRRPQVIARRRSRVSRKRRRGSAMHSSTASGRPRPSRRRKAAAESPSASVSRRPRLSARRPRRSAQEGRGGRGQAPGGREGAGGARGRGPCRARGRAAAPARRRGGGRGVRALGGRGRIPPAAGADHRAQLDPTALGPSGLECTLYVTQAPGGTVMTCAWSCNGDQAVKESITNAVFRASPLPPPRDRALPAAARVVFRPKE